MFILKTRSSLEVKNWIPKNGNGVKLKWAPCQQHLLLTELLFRFITHVCEQKSLTGLAVSAPKHASQVCTSKGGRASQSAASRGWHCISAVKDLKLVQTLRSIKVYVLTCMMQMMDTILHQVGVNQNPMYCVYSG